MMAYGPVYKGPSGAGHSRRQQSIDNSDLPSPMGGSPATGPVPVETCAANARGSRRSPAAAWGSGAARQGSECLLDVGSNLVACAPDASCNLVCFVRCTPPLPTACPAGTRGKLWQVVALVRCAWGAGGKAQGHGGGEGRCMAGMRAAACQGLPCNH